MHHPGPPQFLAVGESVQVAPRDPDPDADYTWRVKSAPVASSIDLGDDPIVAFSPDAPGRYVLELEAPDGVHELTIRVFPGEKAPVGAGSGASGMSGVSGYSGVSGVSGVSGMSGASGSGSGARGAEGGRGGRPRIQLHGAVEGDEVVVRADARPNPNDDRDADDVDVEFLLDDRDDLTEADVTVEGHELRIPVSALPDVVRVHAVAITDSYSVADALRIDRSGEGVEVRREDARTDGGEAGNRRSRASGAADARPGADPRTDGGTAVETADREDQRVRFDRPNEPPEWAKSITLYEIYVRTYADEGEGSTFDALEERLDYLADLGVDCVWLTPVLQNDHAPHGYNIVDFFSIAEDLGTEEEYRTFVEAAHDRGIKVLFDLVLNHSAREHPYFEDAYRNPDSEYYDWYEWQESGEPGTYFDWEYIANWNHSNLEVRRHLLDAVDKWSDVVDGFRCDMAWSVPQPLWQEVRDLVKAKNPEFLLLDETIPYIADFHELTFDMHFDTTLYFTLRQVGRGHESADAILDAVEQRTEVGFPDHAAFMLYLENHDETRYLVECGRPEVEAAAGALCTLPGVPMLYAGQELGQLGNRDPIVWEEADEALHAHYKRLIEVRKETPALGFEGSLARVDYESDSDRVVAFARERDGERYVVLLNFGADPASVRVDPAVDPTDVVSGESVADGDELRVDSVAVLRAE